MLDSKKLIFLINLDNWEYIISIKSTNNENKIISPILTFYSTQILEKWAKRIDLDENILLATCFTQYLNNGFTLQ